MPIYDCEWDFDDQHGEIRAEDDIVEGVLLHMIRDAREGTHTMATITITKV